MTTYAARQKLTRLILALMLSVPLLSAAESSESLAAMDWPLQPGESVSDLSRLIYPKSKHMQQHFIAETIKLNQESQSDLRATSVFEQEHQIRIPSIKALSKKVYPELCVKTSVSGAADNFIFRVQIFINIQRLV